VVGLLSVPATAVPGRPPRVSLRIDDAAASRVNVRVTVTDLASRRPVLVVRLGWIPAGRVVSVHWPRGAALRPGAYHVSLVARDGHGASLLRRAHSSGVSTLKVSAVPAPPVTISAGLPESGAATPAATAGAGAVFPVAGAHSYGGPENRFGATRAGHTHEGQDVLTSEGTPIVAPLSGVVVTASFQEGGAGYYVVEHTSVGLDFMFAHCEAGSLAVSTGEPITAGALLCAAGATGDATAPHLHFEVWVGAWQQGGRAVDPLPYLQAWDHSGAS
jgi:murein DD-endopeptidase MepM/ murein hydrolase activator NlpD